MHIVLFFFNDTATTEIYTLSLHDALPISIVDVTIAASTMPVATVAATSREMNAPAKFRRAAIPRSEEHTSELQSRQYLVCRLLLEKKIILNTSYYTLYFSYMLVHLHSFHL